MLKKILHSLITGTITGTFIGVILSVLFSFVYSNEYYWPAPPKFMAYFSNETSAMLAAILIWSAMGIIFSLTGLIYSETDWSITKMTLIHFCISYLAFLPLAVLIGWVSLKAIVLLSFTTIFLFIYITIWFISMLKAKKEIEALNRHLDHHK